MGKLVWWFNLIVGLVLSYALVFGPLILGIISFFVLKLNLFGAILVTVFSYLTVFLFFKVWDGVERIKNGKKKVVTAGTQEREGESNSPPYGIPIREVGEELLHLTPDHFKDKVVGQDRAIEEFVRGIKLGAQQLLRGNKKRERVIASAIFVGLTGVGKTETAKTLAELLEPLGYQFVRIDLNMYSDSHSAWSLIGSPRGYVGSDQGGVLTQALKKDPRAVILFDEMEKAHPNLHTTFMTMLDEGYIEDQSFGEKIYLDGAIIIFTSNLFAREINNLTKLERDPTSLELRIRDYVERYFGRPEIVGRIDKIVPFRELKKEDLAEIARRVLARYGEEGRAQELTEKFYSVANRYGVRMFVKKVEEAVLLGNEPPVRDEEEPPKGIDVFNP